MPQHRFKVGALVSLQAERGAPAQRGPFVVEAQMPPVGVLFQYRIKSEGEGFRRVVVETQLSAPGTGRTAVPDRAEEVFRGGEED